jgi:hypothetical protein
MRRLFFALLFFGFVKVAPAYEYHLQYTPAGVVYGLSVAGYQFAENTVIGNCSYYTYSACSGRGCHSTKTYYYNTCTWDLYGNLLSMVAGAPATPPVLYQTGTEIVYAGNGSSITGVDTRNFGFVATPSSHYAWRTPNGGYAVIPDAPYSIAATLLSDGDFPLNFTSVSVKTQVYGTYTTTGGSASISANTCVGAVALGSTCTVTVLYNPKTISCTGSPYGYAYPGIDLSVDTDAGGASTDFTERFTVTAVPICDD